MNPLEAAFPGLVGSGYVVTSPPDERYNCVAWAAGDARRWWWPDPMGGGYWPDAAPVAETLAAFAAAYGASGYAPAGSDVAETGVEKVAVYAKGGRPTHAARQLPSGRWTSKLGRAEDIEHDLAALEGDVYGAVALVLARPRPARGAEI